MLRCVPQKKAASEYKTSINSASVINTNYSIEIKDTANKSASSQLAICK